MTGVYYSATSRDRTGVQINARDLPLAHYDTASRYRAVRIDASIRLPKCAAPCLQTQPPACRRQWLGDWINDHHPRCQFLFTGRWREIGPEAKSSAPATARAGLLDSDGRIERPGPLKRSPAASPLGGLDPSITGLQFGELIRRASNMDSQPPSERACCRDCATGKSLTRAVAYLGGHFAAKTSQPQKK